MHLLTAPEPDCGTGCHVDRDVRFTGKTAPADWLLLSITADAVFFPGVIIKCVKTVRLIFEMRMINLIDYHSRYKSILYNTR